MDPTTLGAESFIVFKMSVIQALVKSRSDYLSVKEVKGHVTRRGGGPTGAPR